MSYSELECPYCHIWFEYDGSDGPFEEDDTFDYECKNCTKVSHIKSEISIHHNIYPLEKEINYLKERLKILETNLETKSVDNDPKSINFEKIYTSNINSLKREIKNLEQVNKDD
jgi:hypothetical protein